MTDRRKLFRVLALIALLFAVFLAGTATNRVKIWYTKLATVCTDTILVSDRDYGIVASAYAYYRIPRSLEVDTVSVDHMPPRSGEPSGSAIVVVEVSKSGKRSDELWRARIDSCGVVYQFSFIEAQTTEIGWTR